MARSTRSAQLETRSARLKLPISKKPVFVRIGPSLGLGYRRNQTAGTWVTRVADGRGGNWTKAIGSADDFDEADGNAVLSFWQAQEKARALGREDRGTHSARPVTLGEARHGRNLDEQPKLGALRPCLGDDQRHLGGGNGSVDRGLLAVPSMRRC